MLAQSEVADDGLDIVESLQNGITDFLIVMFGVGGIWAARDRFWPAVFDAIAPGRDGEAPAPPQPERPGQD